MPKAKFTDRWLRGLSAETRTDFYDETFGDGHGQFGVRVTGRKRTFFFLYYPPGQKPEVGPKGRPVYRRRRVTLGLYIHADDRADGSAALTLAEARARAKDGEAKLVQGVDPFPPEAGGAAAPLTFRRWWAEYMEKGKGSTLKSRRFQDWLVRCHALDFKRPEWPAAFGDLPLDAIRRHHMRAITAHVTSIGSPYSANRVKTAISASLTAAEKQEIIGENPLKLMELPHKARKGERYLRENELRAFWSACEEEDLPKCHVGLRLVLLSMQRPGEVLQMRLSQLDRRHGFWLLPASAMKNGKEHVVPITPEMDRMIDLALSMGAPVGRDGDLLFVRSLPSAGDHHPTFQGKEMDRIRARFGRNIREMAIADADADDDPAVLAVEPEPWTPRDLRRTARTIAGSLRLKTLYLELLMAHTLPNLLGIYDKWDYIEERREALETYNRHLMALLAGEVEPRATVVPMRRPA